MENVMRLSLLIVLALLNPLGTAPASADQMSLDVYKECLVRSLYLLDKVGNNKLGYPGKTTEIQINYPDAFPFQARQLVHTRVEKINKMLDGWLSPPHDISVRLQQFDVSPPDPSTASYTMELRLNWPKRESGRNWGTAQTFDHEYGHLIFFENLARISPHWNQLVRAYVRRRSGPAVHLERVGDATVWTQEWESSKGYNELFADLTAVLGADGNPKTMIEALGNDRPGRDFSPPVIDPENWTDNTPHRIFGPVRGFLWENYISKLPNSDRYGEFLRRVFDVLAKDLIEQTEANPAFDLYADPSAQNARLIGRLKDALKNFP
jgi:hypothetical protein